MNTCSDCGGTMSNTTSKLSHDYASCKYGTHVTDNTFSVPKWSFKIEIPVYVIYLWLLRSRASISDRLSPYCGFIQCIECSDLNWVFNMFVVTHVWANTTKFFKALVYDCNWWCRLPITFIKLIFGLSGGFIRLTYRSSITWNYLYFIFAKTHEIVCLALKHKVNDAAFSKCSSSSQLTVGC